MFQDGGNLVAVPLLVMGLCILIWLIGAQTPPEVKQFLDRVGQYVSLHQRLERELPRLPQKADAAAIAAHKQALQEAIRKARPTAQAGDIFTPSAQDYFRNVVHSEMRGANGKTARKTVLEGNPKIETPAKVRVAVNAGYPDDAPLSTVPPTLLLRLPKLPKELEYRSVGKDLILHDSAANLIVDFIPKIVP